MRARDVQTLAVKTSKMKKSKNKSNKLALLKIKTPEHLYLKRKKKNRDCVTHITTLKETRQCDT